VEDIDMSEIEGMNMVEEQDHPTNHRLEVEYMDMMGIHMVEVGYGYGGGVLPPDESPTRGEGYG
jgi:hypothetical protein